MSYSGGRGQGANLQVGGYTSGVGQYNVLPSAGTGQPTAGQIPGVPVPVPVPVAVPVPVPVPVAVPVPVPVPSNRGFISMLALGYYSDYIQEYLACTFSSHFLIIRLMLLMIRVNKGEMFLKVDPITIILHLIDSI